MFGYEAWNCAAVGIKRALSSAAARSCLGLSAREVGNSLLNLRETERDEKILRNAAGKMAHEMMGATV
jgi:hypothetical protein